MKGSHKVSVKGYYKGLEFRGIWLFRDPTRLRLSDKTGVSTRVSMVSVGFKGLGIQGFRVWDLGLRE